LITTNKYWNNNLEGPGKNNSDGELDSFKKAPINQIIFNYLRHIKIKGCA
jgi:hypothetical protein